MKTARICKCALVVAVLLIAFGSGYADAAPTVDNATGPTADSPTTATLYGQVVATNEAAPTVVRIYVGDNDGEITPSNWDTNFVISTWNEGVAFSTNVTGLYYGNRYYYTVYASNTYGEAWSTVTNFTTLAPTTWSPSDIASLKLWLDADDASTITLNGSTVSQWNDKSRHGRHVSQSTSGSQPGYASSTVSFDGTADYLWNSSPFMYTNGQIDVFLVAAVSTGTDRRIIAEGYDSDNDPIYSFGTYSLNASQMGVFVRGLATSSYGINHAAVSAVNAFTGTSRIYQWRDTGTIVSGRVNGGTEVSTAGYTRQASSFNRFAIGGLLRSGTVAATPAAFNLNEIVISDNLSSDDRELMEGYLAWKWGLEGNLPSGHSYTNSDPYTVLPLGITNTAAANVTSSAADLLGSLDGTQSVFTVSLYWGTNNHMTTTAWEMDNTASNVVVGTYTNVVGQSLSNQVAVTPNIQYYYTYMASNEVTNIWALPNVPYVFSTAAPAIDTLSPTNGAVDVGVEANLVATFAFPVVTNTTGSVVITNLSDNTLTATIAIGDTSQVTVSGSTVTIDPSGVLAFDTQYAVLIDTNALMNSADVFFAGLTNTTQWAFTTVADTVVPSPSPMTFEVLPYADSANSIAMTAAEATDPSMPVEYRFTNTVTGTVSDWSTSRSWTHTGLSQEVSYGFRVQARDALSNATAWSVEAEATIDPPGYIYEAFDYAAGTINGSSQAGGIGMAGAWSSSASYIYGIVTPGLSFSGLTTSGGMVQRSSHDLDAEMHREISILNGTALLAAETTIWFSILMRDDSVWADYANDTFLLATGPIDDRASRPIRLTSGQGLGVAFKYQNVGGTQLMNVHGIITDNGTTTSSAGYITDASPGVKNESTYLIAGQITWAGDGTNDTLRLFNIADPLAPQPLDSEAFATMTDDLDQSLFDTLAIGSMEMAKFDEIRFAPSFNEVMDRAPDLDAPVHTALDPENEAINVPITTDLVITFGENVKAGVGSILVKQISGDATVATIAATNAVVSYGGTSVTIDLPSDLTDSTGYYVLITNGVMQDLAGNAFAGITASAQWAFTTTSADNNPPTPSPMTFEVAPIALDEIAVSMTATTATDITPPISYFFTNTVNGDVSGWMSSRTWTNANLAPAQTHTYRVKAKDGIGNETQWSDPANVMLTLESGGLVYEPFDYATGSINGKAGGVGFATAGWTTTHSGSNPFNVVTPGLSFSNLPTTGLASGRGYHTDDAEMHREITEGNKAALLQDNSQIWFSLLVHNRQHWEVYENLAVVLSTGPFTSYSAVPAISGGEGIGLAFNTLGAIHAFVVDDGVSAYSPNALTVSYNTTNLIAGKITWNQDGSDDTIQLYHFTDLNDWTSFHNGPFATLSADLDQSQFTTIAIASGQISVVDEIRFANTLWDALDMGPPSPSVFRFR